MKLHKLFFTVLLLFAFFQICVGQEKPKAVLIDEFGKACSEEFESKLDNFFVGLNNDPSATGYIIFYGVDNAYEGRNLNYLNAANFFTRFRKLGMNRIITLRGGNQSEMKTQFWIVPTSATPTKPEKEFVKSPISKTTLYDGNFADFNNWYGKLEIYSNSFSDLGCEFSPNTKGFAQELKSNGELTGYLVIYTKFGRGKERADKIANFALREFTKDYKIARHRLKVIYGGNREEPKIDFWLVPKGSNPPTPTPQK